MKNQAKLNFMSFLETLFKLAISLTIIILMVKASTGSANVSPNLFEWTQHSL